MSSALDRAVAKAAVAGARRIVVSQVGPVVAWSGGDPFALDESGADVLALLPPLPPPLHPPRSRGGGCVGMSAAGLALSVSTDSSGVRTLSILWPCDTDPDEPLDGLPEEIRARIRSLALESADKKPFPSSPKGRVGGCGDGPAEEDAVSVWI